jgi:diguanylate cyclase (GGDEF)-like protein/PAS domain S-box-containing protein
MASRRRASPARWSLSALRNLLWPCLLGGLALALATLDEGPRRIVAAAAGVAVGWLLVAWRGRLAEQVRRERVMTNVASQLAAAGTAGEVFEASLLAMRALLPRRHAPCLGLFAGGGDRLELVGATADCGPWTVGTARPAERWGGPLAEAVRRLTPVEKGRDRGPLPRFRTPGAAGVAGRPWALAHPLVFHGRLRGALMVAAFAPLAERVADALALVGAELTLALDRLDQVAELANREAQLQALVRNSSDLIVLVDPGGVVRFLSPAVEQLVGWRPEEVVGQRLLTLFAPGRAGREDRAWARALLRQPADGKAAAADLRRVCRFRSRSGDRRYLEIVGNDLRGEPDAAALVLNVRDVTWRMQFEDDLRRRALHDPLTDLANRAHFEDQVRRASERARRSGRPVAALMLDLDDFKGFNDTLGHVVGDLLLKEVARRLRGCLRAGEVAARLGGDEFVVLLEGADEAAAERVAGRILAVLEPPFEVDGRRIAVGASIGVAVAAAGEGDDADLLDRADVAMYAAKRSGKGRVRAGGVRVPRTA